MGWNDRGCRSRGHGCCPSDRIPILIDTTANGATHGDAGAHQWMHVQHHRLHRPYHPAERDAARLLHRRRVDRADSGTRAMPGGAMTDGPRTRAADPGLSSIEVLSARASGTGARPPSTHPGLVSALLYEFQIVRRRRVHPGIPTPRRSRQVTPERERTDRHRARPPPPGTALRPGWGRCGARTQDLRAAPRGG